MKEETKGRILTVANSAILLLILLCLGAGLRLIRISSQQDRDELHFKASLSSPLGKTIHLQGLAWSHPRRAVVLVLSTHCGFCTKSAPFYRRLVARLTSQDTRTPVVAVFPEKTSEGRAYLDSLGIPVGDVVQAAPGFLGLRGTPGILVVDEKGVVRKAWLGVLSGFEESAVLKEL